MAVNGWADMSLWLSEGVPRLDVGDALEIGPGDAYEGDEVVDCCQVTAIPGGWIVRLSRREFVDAPEGVGDLLPDTWVGDAGCTDGCLWTADAGLVGEVVVSWFSERVGVESPGLLGMSYV